MTEYQIQAARALVASPHFRWMPGMRTSTGLLVARVDARSVALTTAGFALTASDLPDLNDPATLGCLLALAREAWKNNGSATETTVGWRYYSTGGSIRGQGPSEGEALVAAILAAPGKP